MIADPTVGVLSIAATSGTSRLDWIVTLAIVFAMFAICATIVVRGNRADLEIPRTRRQNLRIRRARHGLWFAGRAGTPGRPGALSRRGLDRRILPRLPWPWTGSGGG